MDAQRYIEAGYCPVPLYDGQARGSWKLFQQFFRDAEAAVGIVTHRRAEGKMGAVQIARTWCAAVRIESHDAKLRALLAEAVNRIGGKGPMRIEGNQIVQPFRTDSLIVVSKLPPMYLPKDNFRGVRYRPHRVEFLTDDYFLASGGKWSGGSVPETPRDALPLLDAAQANALRAEIQEIFTQRGAEPWL